MNEKNRLLMLGIITIIVVSIVLIGITYAFFSANVKGNEKATQTVVETANLKLVFIDTELIDIENALPGISTSKNFSVENKGNSALYYNINIINVLNEFISDDLVYKITSDDGGGEKEGTLPDDNSTLINEILINPGEIHTYTIQIIFRETGEDQNQNQGARFKGKLQISTQSMYSESVVFGISEPMGQVIKGLNKKINIVGVNYGQLNCLSENETIATCSTEDEEINILGKEVGTTTIKIVEDIENKEVEYIMNVITVKSEFSYTGNYQEFTAALSGNYMIELWGANSGSYKGSYVKGTAYIEEGTKLYFYVGGANSDTTGVTGGYNGGGTGGSVINTSGGTNHCGTNYRNGGGGATDVRTISGVWNDTSSLNSRIIVASGAGATANGDTDGANSTASMSGVSITRQPGGGKHTGEAGLGGTGVTTTSFFSSSVKGCVYGMGGAGGGYIGGGTGGRQFFIYDYIKSGTAISSSAGSAGTLGKGANGINSTVGNTNNQGGSMGGSAGGLSYINESMFINTEIIAGASDKTKPSNADNNGYAIIERID